MDETDAHPRGQIRLRHRCHPNRRNPEAHGVPDSGCGESRRLGQRGRPQNRRFLRHLHGRSGHRAKWDRAAQNATGRLRRHRGTSRAGACHRRTTARGCRRAEQYQRRDRKSVWNLGHAGPRRSIAYIPLSAAGRSGDARPRILYFAIAANGTASEAIPGARRSHVQTCGFHGPGRPRRARIRAGNRHGTGARHARRIGGRPFRGPMETGGPAVESAGARLGRRCSKPPG